MGYISKNKWKEHYETRNTDNVEATEILTVFNNILKMKGIYLGKCYSNLHLHIQKLSRCSETKTDFIIQHYANGNSQ